MLGSHGNNRCHFLTILDNVLIVSESAGGEERAGRPHPHPRSLLEEAGGECEKSHGGELCRDVLAVILALREVCEHFWRPY